jgi:4-amino-4-deoxy-L-arabinose transferase-like glycosyltransferase
MPGVPWQSPPGRPGWARPALLLLAAAATVLYAWRLSDNPLHPYYSAAVKSMSESWKALLLGGLDPAASITLDKLPGAFVVQALSARIFGFHAWSVILPQVVEGAVTVLVLCRAVRRWQGPVADILAAATYATMPIVAALARSEIADTLLVMLLVLAADA